MESESICSLAPSVNHTNPDDRTVIWYDPTGIFVNVGTHTGSVVDSTDHSIRSEDGGTLRLLLDRIDSDRDVAAQLIAAEALWAFHDGLEFVHIDGEQFANPHPGYLEEADSEMFGWLLGKMTDLVEEYAKRYPTVGVDPN